MTRKDQVREAMRTKATQPVIMTDQEKNILAEHGTTAERYLMGEVPQTFIIKANTPEEKTHAQGLRGVLSKLDAITGNKKRVNIITLVKHEGKQYESVSYPK